MTSPPRLPVPMTPRRTRSAAPITLFQFAVVIVKPAATAPCVVLEMNLRREWLVWDMKFPFLPTAFDELTRLRALLFVHWILSIVLQRSDIKFRDMRKNSQ